MSLEERIKAAVVPIVPICVADHYTGDAEECCTFNFSEIPEGFGDNRPEPCAALCSCTGLPPSGATPAP